MLMKIYTRFLFLTMLLCLFMTNDSKAQLRYIPDPGFRNYLNQNFASCMVGDSLDISCPAVLNATSIDVNSYGIYDYPE